MFPCYFVVAISRLPPVAVSLLFLLSDLFLYLFVSLPYGFSSGYFPHIISVRAVFVWSLFSRYVPDETGALSLWLAV